MLLEPSVFKLLSSRTLRTKLGLEQTLLFSKDRLPAFIRYLEALERLTPKKFYKLVARVVPPYVDPLVPALPTVDGQVVN